MAITDHPQIDARPELDEETTISADELSTREKFHALVARLSRQSVTKHYDAYADIPWDDPEYQIDPHDPRWELTMGDTLGATEWYRSQPQEVRAEIGLYRVATAMKVGLQFENILKRGLLEHAFTLPNGDPAFRYAYHEVIEEAHHGMMFQEFVNRTGFEMAGLGWRERLASPRIVLLGRRFPELFFMFVLGGEDPIDHIQREMLRSKENMHPLLEIIMRHHVTEEARHLSFARHYLKLQTPKLDPVRRFIMSIATPIILGEMCALMIQAPSTLIAKYGIPDHVVREAYGDNPEYRAEAIESLKKVRRLSREIGIVNPLSKLVWKQRKVWAED